MYRECNNLHINTNKMSMFVLFVQQAKTSPQKLKMYSPCVIESHHPVWFDLPKNGNAILECEARSP